MNRAQRSFLADELFSMTLMATAQRGKLYRNESGEPERDAFRCALRSRLSQLVGQYQNAITEAQHLNNISFLTKDFSRAQAAALRDGRFRIGSAQKSLNLYLKYMWCLGWISEPPHCPFDSVVLSKIPGCNSVRWTQLDSLAEYEEVVRKARIEAGNRSLAEWELRLYNAA